MPAGKSRARVTTTAVSGFSLVAKGPSARVHTIPMCAAESIYAKTSFVTAGDVIVRVELCTCVVVLSFSVDG